MSQTQLKTASRMTSLQPIQTVKRTPPTARPTSIALTATPAPAMGPEDELLFDPDEEQYGEAGPGGGYVANGTNIPLGYQNTLKNLTPAAPPPTSVETQPPMLIDLSDPVEKTPSPTTKSVMSGAFFWLVLISGLVTCSLCLLFFSKGGASSSTPPPPPFQSFGDPGFGSDGLGGLGPGGLGGGGYSGF